MSEQSASKPFQKKLSAAALAASLRSDEHAPFTAMIEIADRCNEVCVHCYQIQGQKGEMNTDEVKRTFDELAKLGVLFLTISGGEPTLRRDFLELVEYARQLKFAVKIYTNGLNMKRSMAERLAELAVQEVQISLYSHKAEIHDSVTRVPRSFERTVAGIEFLRDAGVKVVVKSPLMKMNVDELDGYVAFMEQLGVDYGVDPHVDPKEDGDRSTESLRISDSAMKKFRQDERFAYEKVTSSDRPKPILEPALDRSICGACSGRIHIEANGEMRPCTQLNIPVGNVREEGVVEAWNQNARGKEIRELKWSDLHGCRDCDLQPYCVRCFANGLAETGDALGPYISACHRAKLEYEIRHGRSPDVRAGERDNLDVGPFKRDKEHQFITIGDTKLARDLEIIRKVPEFANTQLVQLRKRSVKR